MEESMMFYRRMVDHSHLKSYRMFHCGSSIEIFGNSRSAADFTLRRELFDLDAMFYVTSYYAFPRGQNVPQKYYGIVARIESDGHHAGYTLLITEGDNRALRLGDILPKYDASVGELRAHGPAVERDFSQNPYISQASTDFVHSVHCPCWPKEAYEWTLRKRRNKSPRASVIKLVLKYGCDFVAIAHKSQPERCSELADRRVWRFSFSMAELIIIRNWTPWQRILYRTLSTISKIIANQRGDKRSSLCSYYFKTSMLWATERKPSSFWPNVIDFVGWSESVTNAVCELLGELITMLRLRCCPNYFIQSNNMFDHLSESDVAGDIDSLTEFVHNRKRCIKEVIKFCFGAELAVPQWIYRFELPSWIKRILVIIDRVDNPEDNFKDLLKPFSIELQDTLDAELHDIYAGINLQLKTLSCVCENADDNALRDAVEHFKRSSSSLRSNRIDAIINNASHTVVTNLIPNSFRSCSYGCLDHLQQYDTAHQTSEHSELTIGRYGENSRKCLLFNRDDESTEFNGINSDGICAISNSELTIGRYGEYSWKCLLYNRDDENTELDSCNRSRACAVSNSALVDIVRFKYRLDCGRTYGVPFNFYHELHGTSPTINVSWFVAKAQLANIYYNSSNPKATIETCKEIIKLYGKSNWNKELAEKTFPVILSTEWAASYNNEIQDLLGFLSLWSFISNSEVGCRSRSIFLDVCPVFFARYLEACCVGDGANIYNLNELKNCWDGGYMQHSKECKFNTAYTIIEALPFAYKNFITARLERILSDLGLSFPGS